MPYESQLHDETMRLAALACYPILDTAPEAAVGHVVSLVRTAMTAPIAAVSLIDEERQWSKARSGLGVGETARSVSFCAHAIQTREPLVIPDAHRRALREEYAGRLQTLYRGLCGHPAGFARWV